MVTFTIHPFPKKVKHHSGYFTKNVRKKGGLQARGAASIAAGVLWRCRRSCKRPQKSGFVLCFCPEREFLFSRFLFHVHSAVSSIKVPHEVIPSCYLLSILSLLAEKSKGTKPFSEKKKRHKQYMIPAAPSPPGSGCFRRPCDPFGTRTPALLSARCQWRGRSSCTAAFDCRRRREVPSFTNFRPPCLCPGAEPESCP